ncbi:MAG: type II secretion system F family protein, partial [bacterium]
MIHYEFRALDQSGDLIEEQRIAQNESRLRKQLEENGMTLVSVISKKRFSISPIQHNRILARFFHNMELFLASGMELISCLEQIKSRLDNAQFQSCVESLISNLKSGVSLRHSMEQCQPVIPESAARICGVAEETGYLEETFGELSDYYRSRYDFYNELYSTLLYPVLVVGVALVVLVFIMTFILPQLSTLFAQQDIALPAITRGMLLVSNLFQGMMLWVTLGTALTATVAIYWFARSTYAHELVEKFAYHVPIYRKIKTQEFCLSMSMATAVNMDITRAMSMAADVVNHPRLAEQINDARHEVESGVPLTDALQDTQLEGLPYDTLSMGEQTGNLSDVFSFSSDLLNEEIEETLERRAQYIEPVVLFLLAIIVGFIVASV